MPERLFPDAGHMGEVYSDITFPESHPEDDSLPYVFINMVSSLDGKASVGGKSGTIGSEDDRTAMRVLRSKSDAVMSGSGTLRAEKVSLTSEGRRDPEPFAVIPSVSLNLPLSENLKDSDPERTLILTTEGAAEENRSSVEEMSELAKVIPLRETDGRLDFVGALRYLKSEFGVGRLLLEGGPGLNHRLTSYAKPQLVQELFVTVAPKLLGGAQNESHTIIEGVVLEPELRTTLKGLYISDNGEVFLRSRLLSR